METNPFDCYHNAREMPPDLEKLYRKVLRGGFAKYGYLWLAARDCRSDRRSFASRRGWSRRLERLAGVRASR